MNLQAKNLASALNFSLVFVMIIEIVTVTKFILYFMVIVVSITPIRRKKSHFVTTFQVSSFLPVKIFFDD